MNAVATVPGVCDGALVGISPNRVVIKIPTLHEADDPGFRVKLADDFQKADNKIKLFGQSSNI